MLLVSQPTPFTRLVPLPQVLQAETAMAHNCPLPREFLLAICPGGYLTTPSPGAASYLQGLTDMKNTKDQATTSRQEQLHVCNSHSRALCGIRVNPDSRRDHILSSASPPGPSASFTPLPSEIFTAQNDMHLNLFFRPYFYYRE